MDYSTWEPKRCKQCGFKGYVAPGTRFCSEPHPDKKGYCGYTLEPIDSGNLPPGVYQAHQTLIKDERARLKKLWDEMKDENNDGGGWLNGEII